MATSNDTPWVIESTHLHHYIKNAHGEEMAAVIRPIHDLDKSGEELENTEAYQKARRIIDAVNGANAATATA